MFRNILLFLLLFICCEKSFAQSAVDSISRDSVKVKTMTGLAGSAFTVPVGKVWKVISLMCNTGTYNVLVTSVKFEPLYKAGEKISCPFWSAEAELLDGNGNTSLMYVLKVEEAVAK